MYQCKKCLARWNMENHNHICDGLMKLLINNYKKNK